MRSLITRNLISKSGEKKSVLRLCTGVITVWVLALPPAVCSAQAAPPGPATALYRQIGNLGLDATQVYNVRDAAIDREDVHMSLEDGTIAFTQAVNGRITGALFDGEGTVLIVPPNRVERHSLGMFTKSAVMNERFTRAYFRFDDPHFISDLRPFLLPLEDGQDFVEKNDSVAKSLSALDALRLLISLTRKPPANAKAGPFSGEFIHARFVGPSGTFDASWDTASSEQIAVGQSSYTERGTFYDQWMVFPMRSLRQRDAERQAKGLSNDELHVDAVQITDYNMRAAINLPTELAVDATLSMDVNQGGDEVVFFELSRYLKLSSVALDDGKGRELPLEYIQNEALEGTQLARRGNDVVAVAFPGPLVSPKKIRVHFKYAGAVLSEAGGGLLYVGERGTWYPSRGPMMSNYDLQFAAPAEWKLVATGKLVHDETRDGIETTHWISERPLPLAGFNLGKYTTAEVRSKVGDVRVIAYASSGLERGFPVSAPPDISVRTGEPPIPGLPEQMPVVPAQNSKMIAERARDTIDFLSPRLGAYPYSALSLTQMPGTDSQGWPGLVFLSSHVFLTPEQRAEGRPVHSRSAEEMIYNDLMEAHETAHQWWGDAVFWQSYRDQWLMEALANYCALLQIETHAPEEAKALLEFYRKGLETPARGESQPRKNAGPVSFGLRLDSAPFPHAYETVAYGRGTWLIHMLRSMLRDAQREELRTGKQAKTKAEERDPDALFYSVLLDLQKKFAGKMMSTQDVQLALEAVWPPSLRYEGQKSLEWFFDGWVNGTAIPKYEFSDVKFSAVAGKNFARANLLQKNAPDSLVTSVPIYAQTSGGLVFVDRVFADGEETQLRLRVPPGTKRLVVDPYDTVLKEN